MYVLHAFAQLVPYTNTSTERGDPKRKKTRLKYMKNDKDNYLQSFY